MRFFAKQGIGSLSRSEQIAAALAAIARPDAAAAVQQLFEDEPEAEWRAHIETTANELSGTEPDEDEDRPESEPEAGRANAERKA